MPAEAAEIDNEDKIVIPPTASINKMADRFKEAVAKGNVPSAAERAETIAKEKTDLQAKAQADAAAKVAADAAKAAAKDPPKGEDKKAKIPAENFKILESQRDEFKSKAEQLEAKAKDLETKLSQAVDPAKIAELQKKLDETNSKASEYETIVQRFYVEHSPTFKAAFSEKITQSQIEAKDAVGAEHASKIEALLKMPPSETRDKAIEEIGDELRPFQQSSLVKAYTDLRRIERERDAELAKAPENFKKLQQFNAEQATKAHAQEMAALESAFKSETGEFMQKLPEFQPIEGNEAHNSFVKANIETARSFLGAKTPTDLARIALWAARGHAALEMDAKKDALIEKLSSQVKELQSAGPTLGGKGGGKGGAETQPKTAAEKFREAMSKGIPAKT